MAETNKLNCPDCGAEMNHHADKRDYAAAPDETSDTSEGGTVIEAHTCPHCGHTATRAAAR